jgi:hypothetical protein
MVVNVVEVASTQAEFSAPVPVYDAGMNLIGYARGKGVSVNNNVTLIVDAFFKKPEGAEEYAEYMKLARSVFEKGTGIDTIKKVFQLYKREVPDIFEVRRIFFEVTDPKLDMTVGVNGIRLHIVWDYDTGRYSMFYLPPLEMVEELNTRIAHYLAITKGATRSLEDLARLRAENRDLRSRVAVLENALGKTQSWLERHVAKLGELQASLLDLKLAASGNMSKEEVSSYLSEMKGVLKDISDWSRENLTTILQGRDVVLGEETKAMKALKEMVDSVKALVEPSLTEEQITELLAEVIARYPEWVAQQIERHRAAFTGVPSAVAPPAEEVAGEAEEAEATEETKGGEEG